MADRGERQRVNFDVNPAVGALLDESQQQEQARRRARQRRRPPRRRARQQKNLRVDPRTGRMLDLVAAAEGTSPAGVLDLFVARAVELYVREEIEFDGVLEESRSPGQDWVVRVPGLDDLLERLVAFVEDGEV